MADWKCPACGAALDDYDVVYAGMRINDLCCPECRLYLAVMGETLITAERTIVPENYGAQRLLSKATEAYDIIRMLVWSRKIHDRTNCLCRWCKARRFLAENVAFALPPRRERGHDDFVDGVEDGRHLVEASWWAGIKHESNSGQCEVHGCTTYGDSVTVLDEFPARLCIPHRRAWGAACASLQLRLRKISYEIRLIEYAVGAGTMIHASAEVSLMTALDARDKVLEEARALFYAALEHPEDQASICGFEDCDEEPTATFDGEISFCAHHAAEALVATLDRAEVIRVLQVTGYPDIATAMEPAEGPPAEGP